MNEVHLITPFSNASGGSEWRLLELFRLLSDGADVRLWATEQPDPALARRFPITVIGDEHPERGVFVFGGSWYGEGLGEWIGEASPDRSVVIHNVTRMHRADILEFIAKVSVSGARRVEHVFASRYVQRFIGLDGPIQVSLVDLERFSPTANRHRTAFAVGRLSRDELNKHSPDDLALYERLVGEGCRVRVMGGTCLIPYVPVRDAFDGSSIADSVINGRIELTPACTFDGVEFLHSLDCFLYRTDGFLIEAHGRVVQEAMACGLPVVCHRLGGYAEYIEHGANGFLFDDNDGAAAIVLKLKQDAALRSSVGAAARRTMEQLFSEEQRAELKRFYLS
jgi:glycosyltransferase involved in cell wall biosynthesis